MPFSELIRLAEGKVDTPQQKTSNLSTDLSYEGDKGCAELVWDNGQIVVQTQSSRARRGPFSNNFSSFIPNPRDGKDAKNSKPKFNATDSVLNDFPLSAPSCEMDLDQDDSVVPWLSCPVMEPFNNVYSSNMLPDSFGVTGNELSAENSLSSMEKGNSCNHVTEFTDSSSAANASSSLQGGTSKIPPSAIEPNRLRKSEASSFIESQQAMPRSGSSELNHRNAGNGRHAETRMPCSSPFGGSSGMKLHNINVGQPNNASGLMNFSYFSRFASPTGDNMRNTAKVAGADPSDVQREGNENKGNPSNSHNHVESTIMNSSVGFSQQESGSHLQPSMPPSHGCQESVNPKSDSVPPQQSVAILREPNAKSDKSLDKSFGLAPTKLVVGGEKTPEPAVATSSVCSGNSLERASNNPISNSKRKSCDTGDTEGPIDEFEEESVGVRNTSPCRTGSKRSRAAEVHNLSERRRRDRINEKMRALQELIPNCNKADKASMLDDAIEYLKTLQLQVQMLSMGSGMYMPPMMFPAAMQHMHRVNMPQFSPMGIGMGIGMGFGMSMPNVNNGMMQMPSIQGPSYPIVGPPTSSSFAFHGPAGSSHQGLGHLGQGLPMSTPHVPLPFLGGLPMRLPMGNVPCMPGIADVLHSATSSSPKDMAQNFSSQAMLNAYANSSVNQHQGAILRDDQSQADQHQAAILRDDQSQADAGEAQYPRSHSNTKPS